MPNGLPVTTFIELKLPVFVFLASVVFGSTVLESEIRVSKIGLSISSSKFSSFLRGQNLGFFF